MGSETAGLVHSPKRVNRLDGRSQSLVTLLEAHVQQSLKQRRSATCSMDALSGENLREFLDTRPGSCE